MSIFDGVVAPQIKVEFNLASPLGPKASPTWTQVATDYVRAISIRRGKTQENQLVQAGECTITFDNRSGDFDPMNEDSPYWIGPVGTIPGWSYLSRNLPVRVTARWGATDYTIFVGYMEQLSMDWGLNPTATLTFTDAFAWFAQSQIPALPDDPTTGRPSPVGNGDAAWYRITRIQSQMTGTPWPSALNTLDTSVDATMYGTTFGADALTLLQQAADCAGARLFITRSGNLRLTPWDGGADLGITLSDDPTNTAAIGYDQIEVDPGSKYLVNWVYVNKVDGTGTSRGRVLALDAASVVRFGISQESYTLPVNTAQPLAEKLAYRYSEPIDRVRRISFSNTNLGSKFFDVLRAELADNIGIQRTTYDGRTVVFECAIEGIEHDITPESWRTAFICSTLTATPTPPTGDWLGAMQSAGDDAIAFTQVVADGEATIAVGSCGTALLVARISAEGLVEWQRGVEGVGSASTVMVGPDGSIYLYGGSTNSILTRLDSEGFPEWAIEIPGLVAGGACLNGDIYITGGSTSGGTDPRQGLAVLRVDADTGDIVWQKRMESGPSSQGNAITVSANHVYAVGTWNSGGQKCYVTKWSLSGSLVWESCFDTYGSSLTGVGADSVGNIYTSTDRSLFKLSSAGVVQWGVGYPNTGRNLSAVSVDGDCYIAGGTGGVANLAKIDSSGALEYQRVFSGDGVLTRFALTISGDLRGVGNISPDAGLVGRLPSDGTKTDTYTIDLPSGPEDVTYAGQTGTYSSESSTDVTSTLTVTTPTLTASALTPTYINPLVTWSTVYF